MLNWFKKKAVKISATLKVDVHSHLLPGLDDGVKNFDEAVAIIQFLRDVGYSTLITTPHVMADIYRNTTEDINQKLEALRLYLKEKNIDIQLAAAAEYYLDEGLVSKLEANEPLLTLGKKYLLFETNFLNEPLNLKEFIFLAKTKGYTPVLAHPERYLYLQNKLDKVEDLLNRGVLLQANISSIVGFYSKPAQHMCSALIDKGWVHWLGSDCHHLAHAKLIVEAQRHKYFQKALTLPLLNNTLQ